MAETKVQVNRLSTGSQTLFAYRRPALRYISVTEVEAEDILVNNTTSILFPDGDFRSVTTNGSMGRFNITRNASLSGSKQSGLRTTLSEANNTWYAIYAVKTTDDASSFVLVGDTLYPTVANYSTLNSNFGTNGWVYLGMIVNGNNSNLTSSIINFSQNGNFSFVTGIASSGSAIVAKGLALATTTGVSSLTYTYASGTALPNLPSFLTTGIYGAAQTANPAGMRVRNSDSTADLFAVGLTTSVNGYIQFVSDLASGVKVSSSDGGSENFDVLICAWWDPVLGVGSNPVL